MSILDYELLQGYIPSDLKPNNFKTYTDYCRIKIKLADNVKLHEDQYIKIKFNKADKSGYENFNELNTIQKLPLYYTIGTYETWRTGSTEADAGGGWDYSINRKNNPYKWNKCYIDSDYFITIPKAAFKNDPETKENCIYIYLLGFFNTFLYNYNYSNPFNIEVKSLPGKLAVLGTYGMNHLELEGNLCSLLYGDKQEYWDWSTTTTSAKEEGNYNIRFENSDFTSVKNVVINDLSTLNEYSCSYMFKNNKYLKNIPDCIKTIYISKLNEDSVYYNMFYGCTSLEEVTLNIIEDTSSYNKRPYSYTFNNCTSLRNIYIKYDYDKTKSLPCNLNSCVFSNPFENCTSVEKVSYSMDSPFDSNNVDHSWRYFGDGNNLFELGLSIGANINSNTYVTFPNFIDGRVGPGSYSNATDNDVAYEGATALGYYSKYSSYWGEHPWKVGHPSNPSMPNLGLGDSTTYIDLHLFLNNNNGKQYFGRIKSIPNDSTYSSIIKKIDNYSGVDQVSSTAPYPIVSLGSMEVFVSDGYIIGSVRCYDSGVNNYVTTLYKLYNNDTKTYVKVTDDINKNYDYPNHGDVVNLYFNSFT